MPYIDRPGRSAREAQREACRRHYRKHKKSYFARNRRHRAKMREYLNETKSVPCKDCGQSYPPYVMDFDHRDPSKKKYTISMARGLWTWKSLRAEVAKCDVVCSNCHRIRTHGLCDSKKAKRAKTGT